jgi:hypothetical protein
MAEQILTVHNSKLTYATLKKMFALVDLYIDVKTHLTYYFSEILTDNDE